MRNSKKLLCMLLSLIMVFSVFTVAAVPAGAYNSEGDFSKISPDGYNPWDSYTVDAKTPYSEDAIVACGGDLSETQTIYFQAPEDWANKYNTFEGPDDSEPYMHVCAYWWSGIAGSDDMGWPSGKGCTWVGYQAHLVDKANRIYSIKMPNDGGSPIVVWNNGVNGGMDKSAAIFQYGRQIIDANTEGAYEGDYDTLPEGSPTQDDFDGCIQIIDYTVSTPNPFTGFPSFGSNWYVYYGKGCYGSYSTTSDHFTSRYDNCLNPEHLADPEKYHPNPSDVNRDKITDILDAELIQEYLVKLEDLTDPQKAYADVDEDSYISVIDATRIQRYIAGLCNIDGTGYRYRLSAKSDHDLRSVAALETMPATEPDTTEAPMTEPTQPATHGPEQPIDPTKVYINADGDIYEVNPGETLTYSYYLSNGGLAAGIDAATMIDTPYLTMLGDPEYPLLADGTVVDNKFDDGYGNVNELRFTYSSPYGADFSSDDSKLVTFKVKVADDIVPGIYRIFTKINTLCDEYEEKQIFNGTDVTPYRFIRREGVIEGATWIRKDVTEYTVNDGEHTIGDGIDVLFIVNGAKDDEFTCSKFRGLYIDDQPVSFENFDSESGSLKLTLKASYMDNLETGEHIMKYEFSDGTALGTLSITKREYESPTEIHVGPGSTPDSSGSGTSGEVKYHPEDIPNGKSGCLNFYVPTTGWKDFGRIGFYMAEVGGYEWKPWGARALFNSEETSPGVWSFNPEANGYPIEVGKQYYVIFVNQNTGAWTANLLFDSTCLGDIAYCDGTTQENEFDSNKSSLVARWKNSSLGPMKCITSIGNVVGETVPANTTSYKMFVKFLKNTLSNARWYSGKSDQDIIDDVAGALELTDTDIEKAIKEAGVTVDWKAPTKEDIHGYILKNYYLTGSINGDNSGLTDVHKELRFTDSGSGDMVLSGVKLKEGDKVKAALYNGGKAFTLYPDGVGREVVIDKSGVYDFYFKPYEMGNPNYWYITPSYVGEAEPGVTVRGSIKSYIDDSDVTVKLTGTDNNYTAKTTGKSDYSVTDVPAGEYTLTVSKANHVTREYTVTVADTDVTKDVEICPLGDVTGDGKTNVQDCTAILRYVRKLDMDLSDYQLKRADVTGDNKVNVQDVTKILRHVRKIEALY